MQGKTHLYVIIIVLLLFIAAILLGFFDRGDVRFSDDVLQILSDRQAVAVIGVDSRGNISMVSRTGKDAQPCELNPNSKNRCRGIDKGLLAAETITLLKTEGSFCYARVKPDGTVEQVCFPE